MIKESIKRLKNDEKFIKEKSDITEIDKGENILNSMFFEERKCSEETTEKSGISSKDKVKDMTEDSKSNEHKNGLLNKFKSVLKNSPIIVAFVTIITFISPYIMGPINEYKIKNLIGNLHVNYIQAVNEGNSDMINDYVIKDSDAYREYRKNIPEFYEKQITLEDRGQTINYINEEEDKKYRVTTIDKFSIKYKDGSIKHQDEKKDYIVVKDLHTKKLLIYKIENFNIVG